VNIVPQVSDGLHAAIDGLKQKKHNEC